MSAKRSVYEMVGESLREMGTLTVVFVAIDSVFQAQPFPAVKFCGIGMTVGSAVFALGIWVERKRDSWEGGKL